MFELDIVATIESRASRHGLTPDDIAPMLQALDAVAEKFGCDGNALYMILLDSISGGTALTKDQILSQIKIGLDNHGYKMGIGV